MITDDNYELYFLQYLEGTLRPKERKEVEAFMAQHPDLAEELTLYAEAPIIEKDASVVYANKESLKHQSSMPFRIGSTPWRWSAAAVVLVAVGAIFALRNSNVEPVVPQLAVTRPAVKVLPIRENVMAEEPIAVKPQTVHPAPDIAKVIEQETIEEHLEPVVEEETLQTFAPTPLLAEATEKDDLESALYRELELLLSMPDACVAEAKSAEDDGIFATTANYYNPSTEQMVNVVVKGYEAKLAYDRIMEKTESFREALSVIFS